MLLEPHDSAGASCTQEMLVLDHRQTRPPPCVLQDMLHDYNTPFQLARLEEDDEEDEIDSPDDAELYDIEVSCRLVGGQAAG